KVTEGLKGNRLQSQILDHLSNVGRRAVERQKVVLEQLHAFEAGVSDRLQFLVQSTAETDCCNRVFHASSELFGRHPDGQVIHGAPRGSFPFASVKSTQASM